MNVCWPYFHTTVCLTLPHSLKQCVPSFVEGSFESYLLVYLFLSHKFLFVKEMQDHLRIGSALLDCVLLCIIRLCCIFLCWHQILIAIVL